MFNVVLVLVKTSHATLCNNRAYLLTQGANTWETKHMERKTKL
jgi:hypothetical protein